MKFCKDCKHHKAVKIEAYIAAHLCMRKPSRHHRVTGNPLHERVDCDNERMYGRVISWLEGKCGSEGRFYEPLTDDEGDE
jgi:hypothetical protein